MINHTLSSAASVIKQIRVWFYATVVLHNAQHSVVPLRLSAAQCLLVKLYWSVEEGAKGELLACSSFRGNSSPCSEVFLVTYFFPSSSQMALYPRRRLNMIGSSHIALDFKTRRDPGY